MKAQDRKDAISKIMMSSMKDLFPECRDLKTFDGVTCSHQNTCCFKIVDSKKLTVARAKKMYKDITNTFGLKFEVLLSNYIGDRLFFVSGSSDMIKKHPYIHRIQIHRHDTDKYWFVHISYWTPEKKELKQLMSNITQQGES